MKTTPKIPHIPEEERTPLVVALLEIIQVLLEQNQDLRDEIAVLKGQKPKPKIKPSVLEKEPVTQATSDAMGKRPGSAKREKTKNIEIHDTVVIPVLDVPPGSRRKDFVDFTVQGILFRLHNTRYRRERWVTPQGVTITAPLPAHLKGIGSHFDSTLQSFVLSQYYHSHVTQPLILEQLRELGVDISAGQINRIITEDKGRFHAEKEEILRVGLAHSTYINVDDTGARHRGTNGFCTVICNQGFASFHSTGSKSRRNFLELVRAGRSDYALTRDALAYMEMHGLPRAPYERLAGLGEMVFEDLRAWETALKSLGLTNERHVRIATEGALLGSILRNGLTNEDLAIISDDAGQFDVLLHALCWVHAERPIKKLTGLNDIQRESLERTRDGIWALYRKLKAYRKTPDPIKRAELENGFDEIFSAQTPYETLNRALSGIRGKKSELLLVLDRPDIPLHNNAAETDLREYVKKKKISGSTRSDMGQRCRDTFTSLKKTARKLGVSFWSYLQDRVSGRNSIPWLPDLLRQRLGEAPG